MIFNLTGYSPPSLQWSPVEALRKLGWGVGEGLTSDRGGGSLVVPVMKMVMTNDGGDGKNEWMLMVVYNRVVALTNHIYANGIHIEMHAIL